MAEEQQPKKPMMNKWVLAAILFIIAIFMGVSVAYKIITVGP